MPVKPVPDGHHTVTPCLMVKGARRFIDFMVQVFDARLTEQLLRPDGRMGHTELRVGDSVIMLSEEMEPGGATPVMLHFYVDDADVVFERAVGAGAAVMSPMADQFYGDRSGGVREPCGNTLWIATHVEDVPPRGAQAPRCRGDEDEGLRKPARTRSTSPVRR